MLLLAVCGACRATEPEEGVDPLEAEPVVVGGGGLPAARREAPSLLALRGALEEGEDALARELIEGIRRRDPDEATLETLAAYERILRGRELVAGLELRLGAQPDQGEPGQDWIVVHARNANPVDVVLDLPPVPVERRRTAIDAEGGGGKRMRSKRTEVFRDLELPRGEARTLVLFLAQAPRGDALAVRESWSLEPRGGEIEAEGERYPAARVRVAPFERTLISETLPQEVASPDELVALLERPELDPGAALRLAVRVPRAEHAALLARLAPLVRRLERDDPERAAGLAPLFAWLAGADATGAAGEAAHDDEPIETEPIPRPRLDLPFPSDSE